MLSIDIFKFLILIFMLDLNFDYLLLILYPNITYLIRERKQI